MPSPAGKCEPTPLRVAITFDDHVQPSSAEPMHAADRVRSSSPEGVVLDRRRTLTSRPLRRRSTTSTDSDEHEYWHAGTMRAPLSSGFGISEDDLLQSNNEEEGEVEVVEVVEEVTTLKSINVKGGAEAVKRRAAAWSDSDDESIEVVYAEPHGETITLPDTDSEAAGTSSDMQIDDDDEDEDAAAVASDVEGDTLMPKLVIIEGENDSEEEEVDEEEHYTLDIDGELSRAGEDIAVEVATYTTIEIEEQGHTSPSAEEEEAKEEQAEGVSVDSPPSQRLPSPISPEQISSCALAEASPPPTSTGVSPVLEAFLSDDTRVFPPSQIKQKHSLFGAGSFFDKLSHSKPYRRVPLYKPRSDSSAAPQQSSGLPSVAANADDEVASQTSHLPSPTSSVEPELGAEEQHEALNPWDHAGDWGSSIFKAAEEDSAAASERGGESRALSVSLFGDDDMPRGEDTDFFDEVEDQDECEEDGDGNDDYEDNYFEYGGSEDEEWFVKDAPEGEFTASARP